MPKNEHQGSQQLATQVATPTVEGEGADAIESYESEVAEQVTSMPLDNAKGNPPEEQGWANALEQLGLAQLFASLDRVIEQAKAEPSIEDSLVSHVIRKQEDLRRASASYRQETTGETLAQVFVDYQDAQQAHIQLTLALQEAYYRDAQEYRWTLEETEVGAEPYQRAVDEAHAEAEPYLKALQEAQAGAQPYHQAVEEALAGSHPYHEALREAQAGTEAHRHALKEAQAGARPYHQALADATSSGSPVAISKASQALTKYYQSTITLAHRTLTNFYKETVQPAYKAITDYHLGTLREAQNALTEYYATTIQAADKALIHHYGTKVVTAQQALDEYHATRIGGAKEALEAFWVEHRLH